MKALRSLAWLLPVSLALGAMLSGLDGGEWVRGWLAYGALLLGGGWLLTALWRYLGGGKRLAWILCLAFFLRFGAGMFFSWALPIYGNDSEAHNAGYVYRDAGTYDSQSWQLAISGDPLLKAFDQSYGMEEQYGGLGFTLALVYRWLSSDLHRPWLTDLLTALMGALGVAMAWKATNTAWGEKVGWVVAWTMAVFPESVLAGASQIREPFVLFFIATAFWALTEWQVRPRRRLWLWLALSLVAGGLFSPGITIVCLVLLGGWAWLRGKRRVIRWWWLAGGAGLLLGGSIFLGVLVGGTLQAPAGPLQNLVDWLRYSALYSAYETEMSSGWIQAIFTRIPEWLQLPFITLYGVMQPLLPAALADPAVWPARLIGILRSLGWYAMLPLLIYSIRPILKTEEKRERQSLIWLWLGTWVWILVCSFRAGGDQWDNPRYRLMLLVFQAGLAGYGLLWGLAKRDAWLKRSLAVEGVFLVCFGYWYYARYSEWTAGQVHVFVILAVIVVLSGLILGGGWIKDCWQEKHARRG